MPEQGRRAQHFQGGSGYTQPENGPPDVTELIEYFVCRREQDFLFGNSPELRTSVQNILIWALCLTILSVALRETHHWH